MLALCVCPLAAILGLLDEPETEFLVCMRVEVGNGLEREARLVLGRVLDFVEEWEEEFVVRRLGLGLVGGLEERMSLDGEERRLEVEVRGEAWMVSEYPESCLSIFMLPIFGLDIVSVLTGDIGRDILLVTAEGWDIGRISI